MSARLCSVKGWVLAVTLVASLGGGTAMCAQEVPAAIPLILPRPASVEAIRAAVSKLQPVSISLVGVELTAPLTHENMDVQIASVMQEFVRQGLDWSIKDFRPTPVIVLYEDPQGKEKVRMVVGAAVPSKVAVKAPLKFLRFKFPKAVRLLHIGPHEEWGGVYRTIGETARVKYPKRHEGWPVILQILDDPKRVKSEEIKTLVTIPLG